MSNSSFPTFICTTRSNGGATIAKPSYATQVTAGSNCTWTYSPSSSLSDASWANQVKAAAGTMPILIFVHGFDDSAGDVATKLMTFGPTLWASNVLTIAFDWPSGSYIKVIAGYAIDQGTAQQSGPDLLALINLLIQHGIPSSQINILTHSMGGLVLQNAFGTQSATLVNNVLMCEADVLKCAFDVNNSEWCTLTCLLSNCTSLTIYASSYDQALEEAPSYSNDFHPTCGCQGGSDTGQNQRLGYSGGPLDYGCPPQTLTQYSSKVNGVDYSAYYNSAYGSNTGAATHVWPLQGTWSGKGTTQQGNRQPGDPAFMADIVNVLYLQPFSSRASSSNNSWTFNPISQVLTPVTSCS